MSIFPLATLFSLLAHLSYAVAPSTPSPIAFDPVQNITYHGTFVNGVEKFLNIPYGQDTSGDNRFANPKPFLFPSYISQYNASTEGPACPQAPPSFSIVAFEENQSEDCLKLKVARPKGTRAGDQLPVMVWIYGGSLYIGNINDRRHEPEGLILQSIENGKPIVFVAMNYRLNIFGFAVSEALEARKSLNVGLKDQRLALEWVQKNIKFFGGDPDRVTIFGQSSGGLSVAMQILAYGGSQHTPFHAAIMQSTALEPGSTSNRSAVTYNEVATLAGCELGNPQSTETVACLRALPFETLLNYTIVQYGSATSDIYLPHVDGDFLPLASSELVRQGLFPKMPVMIGWTEDDLAPFTPATIQTSVDTFDFLRLGFELDNTSTVERILSLYPPSDFPTLPSVNLSSEFYRSARVFRDIALACPSFYFGKTMAMKYAEDDESPKVFYYIHNQTVLSGYFESLGLPAFGASHTSELPYVYTLSGVQCHRGCTPNAERYRVAEENFTVME
ncbi:hypothetical protein VNI00_012132 [Paramarasmius palmivorus]|uniref:Carboxylic ester hydrolase n=1 Tax=Paramarasmius palmivorus TaxID=297713 RepID=A0AAW0C7H9_9AGAR